MKLIGFIGSLCVFLDPEKEMYVISGEEVYLDNLNEWQYRDFLRESGQKFIEISQKEPLAIYERR